MLFIRALYFGSFLALGACAGKKGTSEVKPAAAYRGDLCAATEEINLYLMENTPANTPRDELRQAVGGMARAYPKIAAEADPLQGKTGDTAYGAVASDAEDGVIVAGNLASALAADPEKHADAQTNLKTAVDEWVDYNEGLVHDDATFDPTRWWEEAVWREAFGSPGANGERREEKPLPR